jgi:hypothetical protein
MTCALLNATRPEDQASHSPLASLPYTFFLLNVDMELNKNGQVFVQKML